MRLLKAIAFTASVLSVTACGLADKMGATRAYNYATSDETNTYALTHIDFDLIETKDRNPRIGGFIGFVSDPDRADRFQNRYPVIGNFLPFVGFQLTVPTVGPHEVRMRVSPGYSSDTAIFSIQSNFVF